MLTATTCKRGRSAEYDTSAKYARSCRKFAPLVARAVYGSCASNASVTAITAAILALALFSTLADRLAMMSQALRLLFVEDCVEDVFLATHALKKGGVPFEARVVDDEPGLMHALSDWSPDLIVCDFTLPRFDGFAALEVCRTSASRIPFLFRSGTIGPLRAAEAIKRGAHGALEKDDNDAFLQFVIRLTLDLRIRAAQ